MPAKRTSKAGGQWQPTPRCNGGRASHLSPDARAFVIERILLGDTNVAINVALRKAGHLPSGKGLSDVTLWTYRKSDAVRVNKELLTIEAQQVGHAALSEAVVVSVTVMRAAAKALLNDQTGKFRSSDLQTIRTTAYVFFKAADFIWNRLGMEDPLGFNDKPSGRDAMEQEALSAVQQAEKDAQDKAEMELLVKESMNRILCELVAQKHCELTENAGYTVCGEEPYHAR